MLSLNNAIDYQCKKIIAYTTHKYLDLLISWLTSQDFDLQFLTIEN